MRPVAGLEVRHLSQVALSQQPFPATAAARTMVAVLRPSTMTLALQHASCTASYVQPPTTATGGRVRGERPSAHAGARRAVHAALFPCGFLVA